MKMKEILTPAARKKLGQALPSSLLISQIWTKLPLYMIPITQKLCLWTFYVNFTVRVNLITSPTVAITQFSHLYFFSDFHSLTNVTHRTQNRKQSSLVIA